MCSTSLRKFNPRRLDVIVFGALLLFLGAGSAFAQAPAGPISGAPPADSAPSTPAAKPRAPIGSKPNLSGSWKMNKDDSDDARQRIQQASGNSSGSRTGGNRGGMGGPGMGGPGMGGPGMGGGGHRGGGGDGDQSQTNANSLTNELYQLSIDQTEKSLKVTGGTGRVLAVYSASDSRDSKSSSANNSDSSAPPVSHWEGDQLVTVVQGNHNVKTTRNFGLSFDGTRLVVMTRIENPRFSQPVMIQFIYDSAQASKGTLQ